LFSFSFAPSLPFGVATAASIWWIS
jgi:hypothetical protein